MVEFYWVPATEQDIPFISQVYNENLACLHGVPRDRETWAQLLADPAAEYYIVWEKTPVAWFRIDEEDGGFWLGMLQVKPAFHRRGIGRFVLSTAERMAREKGYSKLGIHTTEDNLPARGLYLSAGYALTEIGPCTTADGVDRVGYTFEKEIAG